MGLISFLKGAGEKVFGWESEEDQKKAQEIADAQERAKQEEKNAKASDALANLVRSHSLEIDNLDVKFDGGVVWLGGDSTSRADAEKASLVVGNVQGVDAVDNSISVTDPTPEAVYHTVAKGEYLSLIAKKYYGDARRYNEIFDANKPMLKDVDLIYPGQVLRIPGAEVQA